MTNCFLQGMKFFFQFIFLSFCDERYNEDETNKTKAVSVGFYSFFLLIVKNAIVFFDLPKILHNSTILTKQLFIFQI